MVSINEIKAVKIWAIVPAAGVGARMSTNIPKQYIQVANKTILEHTLSVLLGFDAIEAVQVCISGQDQFWPDISLDHPHLLPAIEGGATRADSVLAGLKSLKNKAQEHDWVMVHDAARPCITNELLQRLLDTLANNDVGGILAVPVADTLKSVCESSEVQSTIDRSNLWAAQTPQMFRYGLLKESLQTAINDGFEITDEASAIEKSGFKPTIVPSVRSNIKVTYPEDIDLVDHYLKNL